jgi:hypothetical protein
MAHTSIGLSDMLVMILIVAYGALVLPLYCEAGYSTSTREYHVLNVRARIRSALINARRAMLRKTGLRKIDAHRLHGVITGTRICKPTKAFTGIYGEGRRCFAIAIQLEKT